MAHCYILTGLSNSVTVTAVSFTAVKEILSLLEDALHNNKSGM